MSLLYRPADLLTCNSQDMLLICPVSLCMRFCRRKHCCCIRPSRAVCGKLQRQLFSSSLILTTIPASMRPQGKKRAGLARISSHVEDPDAVQAQKTAAYKQTASPKGGQSGSIRTRAKLLQQLLLMTRLTRCCKHSSRSWEI